MESHGMDCPADRAAFLSRIRSSRRLLRLGDADAAIRHAQAAKVYADGYGEADYRARFIADKAQAMADLRRPS